MTTLGIIGVGHLAEYTVRGLRRGGWDDPIVLGPRNPERAARLAADCGCIVAPDSVHVVREAEIVMLATRPDAAPGALAGLPLTSGQVLLSVVAGLPLAELARLAPAAGTIVRAMPVTAAEVCASPTVLYPAHPRVEALFGHCGSAVVLGSEAEFGVATALACAYGWFFPLYAVLARGATAAGLAPETARRLTAGMAAGAAAIVLEDVAADPDDIAATIATPGTFTRTGLELLERAGALGEWERALREVAQRLRGT